MFRRIPPEKILQITFDTLGPEGEHWTTGTLDDGRGSYCAIGAIDHASVLLRASLRQRRAAIQRLAKFIPSYFGDTPQPRIELFNDRISSYVELEELEKGVDLGTWWPRPKAGFTFIAAAFTQAGAKTRQTIEAGLDGPAKRVRVEPIETPANQPPETETPAQPTEAPKEPVPA